MFKSALFYNSTILINYILKFNMNRRWVWDDRQVFLLIKAVKQNPFLWDHHDVEYHNLTKKKKFWSNLATELNNGFPLQRKIKSCDAHTKWNDLRSRFATVYKKKITSSLSNISISWRFYNALEFLIPRMKTNLRPTKCLTKHEKEEYYTLDKPYSNSSFLDDPLSVANSFDNGADNSSSSLFTDQPTTIEFNSHNDTVFNNRFSEVRPESDTNHLMERRTVTANDGFGVYVGLEIEQLDPDLQISAKRQICDVLLELSNEHLSRHILSSD